MDLTTLDFPALVALKENVDKAIAARQAAEKSNAKRQIIELAKLYGLDVEEVLSKPSQPRKPVEAKYRHPDDVNLTWSGRGRKPLWVQQLLDGGKTLDDLLIA